jgi:hypothetical protein
MNKEGSSIQWYRVSQRFPQFSIAKQPQDGGRTGCGAKRSARSGSEGHAVQVNDTMGAIDYRGSVAARG